MIRSIVKFVLITEAFAVATFAFGWWIVPVFAFVLGMTLDRERGPVRYAAVCAAAGWLSLLLLDAARGPLLSLASRFAGVMKLPSIVLIAITLIFPALLAWSAATIGKSLKDLVIAQRGGHTASERNPVTTGMPVVDA
ncbi:MAG TPA: hypothetical protein VM099_12800 [Gemmatimonadaceae bacterium]|nr:hypothetical protein [Gemmatimonadaceae bacterium]